MIFMTLKPSARNRLIQGHMKKNQPASIGSILGDSQAARLMAGASALGKLDSMVRELLPPPLDEHCHVMSLRGDALVMAVDSPVWAARLRFLAPELVKQLAGIQTVKLRTVQVRVRPVDPPPAPQHKLRTPGLTAGNALALEQTAQGVRDAGLKAALLRLAARKRDCAGEG
jgi:hypothetical protein